MADRFDVIGVTYRSFMAPVLASVRQETYGTDIGQVAWLTIEEATRFIELLGLGRHTSVLDLACGSGGLDLFLAKSTGRRIVGMDVDPSALAQAKEAASHSGLQGQASFVRSDGNECWPFDSDTFDAGLCIDSIHHLRDRTATLGEFRRVLRPGGRLLYTDPFVLTGIISLDEIKARTSIVSHFTFSPPGADERLIGDADFDLVLSEDATDNVTEVSDRWSRARDRHRDDLLRLEGEDGFESFQGFLAMTHRLSAEGRLSRRLLVAEKPAFDA